MRSSGGIRRLLQACVFSKKGLITAFKDEAAFRQEFYLALILIPLSLYLGKTGVEKALLIGVTLLLLIAELFNTGIEAIADRFGTERHPLSAKAKDIGSAAVMLSLINLLIVWSCVLLF